MEFSEPTAVTPAAAGGRLLRAQDSETVPARAVGNGQFKPIEDAPGSYVKIRS